MLIYMLEACHPGDTCSLSIAPCRVRLETPVNILTGLGDSPVIIFKCSGNKAPSLKLQRKKAWLILAAAYRESPLSEKRVAGRTSTWTIRPKQNLHQGIQCTTFSTRSYIMVSAGKKSMPACGLRRAMPFHFSSGCTWPSVSCSRYWFNTYYTCNPVQVKGHMFQWYNECMSKDTHWSFVYYIENLEATCIAVNDSRLK